MYKNEYHIYYPSLLQEYNTYKKSRQRQKAAVRYMQYLGKAANREEE